MLRSTEINLSFCYGDRSRTAGVLTTTPRTPRKLPVLRFASWVRWTESIEIHVFSKHKIIYYAWLEWETVIKIS